MKLLRMLPLLGWVLVPGCWAITGPDKVDGYVGGSLSVRCHYDEGYEDNAKLWCKKKKHFLRNSCRTSLESETGKKLRKGNLSIKDNKGKLYFEVTMDELRMDDAGLYQCVVDGPLFDMQDVEVVVFPAPTFDPEKWPSTTEEQERLSTTDQPNPDLSIGGTVESNPSPFPSGSSESELHTLIYCIVPLLILLLLAAVVLVVVSRKKRTGSSLLRKKEINLSNMVSTYNMEDAHKEEPIPDHPPDVDGMGLYRIVAAHPQSNKGIHSQEKASENKDDIPYATLVLPDLQHQAIYDNVALPSHALPQPPNKEVIYTEVAKKPGH